MARHDHPPVGIERPDRLGEQTDGVAHVAALNPITGVGFPELLLPVGQVGLQIELVAELPCENALVWLEGLDDIGRVRLQELGRPASLDSPAAIRFPHVIRNGRINPEKARNQADLQLLGIGRQPGESREILLPVLRIRRQLGCEIYAAIETHDTHPVPAKDVQRGERIAQIDPALSIPLFMQRDKQQFITVRTGRIIFRSVQIDRRGLRAVGRHVESLSRRRVGPVGGHGIRFPCPGAPLRRIAPAAAYGQNGRREQDIR